MNVAGNDMQQKGVDLAKISLLIIAGGKSSRMGRDKRWLSWQGKSFLENMVQRGIGAGFEEIIICAERESEELDELLDAYPMLSVAYDMIKEAGPLVGIYQGLQMMKGEYGWAVSCDMPFFDFSKAQSMVEMIEANPYLKAVVPVAEGRWQPLASIYSRALLPEINSALNEGNRKIRCILQGSSIAVETFDNEKDIFFNVNNEADYQLALGREANRLRKVPIVSISAPKSNTGKTTFIENVIPLLREQGIKCGVVKRDCHGFDLDIEGKDSQRFMAAGAESVAVVSPDSYFIMQKTEGRADLRDVIEKLENVDIVLVESRAHGFFPTISLWRGMGKPLVDERTVALFSSEWQSVDKVSQYNLDDIKSTIELIRFLGGV